jgi:hypothetical protein
MRRAAARQSGHDQWPLDRDVEDLGVPLDDVLDAQAIPA